MLFAKFEKYRSGGGYTPLPPPFPPSYVPKTVRKDFIRKKGLHIIFEDTLSIKFTI